MSVSSIDYSDLRNPPNRLLSPSISRLSMSFAMLESSSVDDDLASLKKELSGSTNKGELPPGRTTGSNSKAAYPFPDLAIEKTLNELRKKANDF